MKKYVIMNSSLSNMGGAQMYIRNKILYLREHGWDAIIIAGRAKNVVIPELREFQETVPELLFCSYFFTAGVRKRTIGLLKGLVSNNQYSDIYIESSSIEVSTWAEQVAEEVGARHLIYLLQEHNIVNNRLLQDFFVFKYNRRELAGISPKSLATMFAEFHPLNDSESYTLPAYCTNVEADVECDIVDRLDRTRYDYVIGAFSRMDKPYVLPAVNDFYRYASSCPEKRFLFLWIGDAPRDSRVPSKINNIFASLHNVDLLITGYLMPVPYKLLEFCDVFISSAGSSWPCMRSGVPTITYDANDFKPIGILGRTTNNSLFRDEGELPQNLSELLDSILIKKEYPKLQAQFSLSIPDFTNHMDFLNKMEKGREYFDMDKVNVESLGEKKIAIGMLLLGPRGYLRLHNLRMK